MAVLSPLKLITCNIEGRKHFARLVPFLQAQQAEVICLQEVFEVDLPMLQEALGMQAHFVPVLNCTYENSYHIEPAGLMGLAIFTRLSTSAVQEQFYVGSREPVAVLEDGNPNSLNRAVLWVDVVKGEQVYRIGTTHFTWSTGGDYSELQGENWAALEKILREELGEFVLCGDFNAPRGGEIYRRISSWLTDNIPPEVTTTIDAEWHKAGNLQLVVDYMFTTQTYQASQVQLHPGVSDHIAVSGLIQKTSSS